MCSENPELLKGFQRVELKAGKGRNISIASPKEELKFWTPNGWTLDDEYIFYVGTDSQNAKEIPANEVENI